MRRSSSETLSSHCKRVIARIASFSAWGETVARPETLLQGCHAYAHCRQDTSPHPTPVAIDACCCPCAYAIRIVCGRRLCPSKCVQVGEVDPVGVSPCFPACEAYSTHGCILKEVTQYFSSSNKDLDEIWRRAIRRHGLVALRPRIFTRRRESAFRLKCRFYYASIYIWHITRSIAKGFGASLYQ